MYRVKFSYSRPGADRRHYINADNVTVILGRLPHELWHMLRAVHFNDRARGKVILGYVNKGRREIAICALPPRVSMKWARSSGDANHYGAIRGAQWPTLAVRRYQLYYTFLHELGHLQIVLPDKTNPRRKYMGERKAHEFANYWRKKLWAKEFDHPDPVHNPPSKEELRLLKSGWIKAHNLYKKGLNLDNAKDTEKAMSYYRQSIEIYSDHTQALERLGMLTCEQGENKSDKPALKQAKAWLGHALSIDPLLPHAGKYLKLVRERLAGPT
jgi:tetratricopeptide (TPR) repeat protein